MSGSFPRRIRLSLLLLLLLPCASPASPGGGPEDRKISHLLNRAAHGPSRADALRVKEIGVEAWIEEQLRPESIDDAALEALAAPLFEDRGFGRRIRGLAELKTLAHLQAIHSRRQLQTVLGIFWENHFSTDGAKVAEYIDALQNSDAGDAFPAAEAKREAAHLEHQEFEYFRRHALGSFEDLLRFSARSPAMLIYLDSVLNVKGRPNENYAREILELHSFGVDHGYVQPDIEQLARCFTGWGVARVPLREAGDPHAPTGVKVSDIVLAAPADLVPASARDWSYFKGTRNPPEGWGKPGFDDAGWLRGPASVGYGDNDDATTLADMPNGYTTLFLRKTFTLADPAALRQHLILTVDVDDGFVAYLNGVEAARFNAPGKAGQPVSFEAVAPMGHEAGPQIQFNLNAFKKHLVAGENVLALVALNVSKGSSDLTLRPTLCDRQVLPGSLETGDPAGVFTFHYTPALHNAADRKTLFKGTPQVLEVAGRDGTGGLEEGELAIRRILDHPSTPLFICVKLIRKLVGDEIDFRTPSEGPYAGLLKRCLETWNAGTPKGNLRDVVRTLLKSEEFWSDRAFQSKIKDPFEFISSSVRAADAQGPGRDLPRLLQGMGMEYFTRKEPDGWPEIGSKLIEMGSFQQRLAFTHLLSGASSRKPVDLAADPLRLFVEADLESPGTIAAAFNRTLFLGSLSAAQEGRIARFIGSGADGAPLPLVRTNPDFEPRLRQTLAFLFSFPQWQYQ